jgi:hypothetical protein
MNLLVWTSQEGGMRRLQESKMLAAETTIRQKKSQVGSKTTLRARTLIPKDPKKILQAQTLRHLDQLNQRKNLLLVTIPNLPELSQMGVQMPSWQVSTQMEVLMQNLPILRQVEVLMPCWLVSSLMEVQMKKGRQKRLGH